MYLLVTDVFTLRKDYRIVGSLSGCLPRAPRQDNFMGVPLILTHEEIDLLVNKFELTALILKVLNDNKKHYSTHFVKKTFVILTFVYRFQRTWPERLVSQF